MATYYYTVVIQEAEPESPGPGWIWIKESINQAFIYLLGTWVPFAGG